MGAGASVSDGISNAEVREALMQHVTTALPEGSPINEQYRVAFGRYDANNDSFVTPDEFLAAVAAQGLAWSQEDCNQILDRLDVDKDGKISFEEFVAFMESDDAPGPPPVDDARLQQVFLEFASFGSADVVREIDNSKFAKLSRDCQLLDRNLTRTDVDLIFTKSKVKGARKLTFEQFRDVAIPLLAAKKFPDEEEAMARSMLANLINANGPVTTGTQADNDGTLARMTDENLYTGAHRRSSVGGTNARQRRRSSIAKTVGVQSEEALERAKQEAADVAAAVAAGQEEEPQHAPDPSERPQRYEPAEDEAENSGGVNYDREAVQRVFLEFASFGSSDMVRDIDNSKFAKLARDCKLLDRHLTKTDVDLIFASSKPSSVRRLDFRTFEANALPALAKKKFPQMTDADATYALAQVIAQCAPSSTGTNVDNDSTLNRLSVSNPGGGVAARRRSSIAARTSSTTPDSAAIAIARGENGEGASAGAAEEGNGGRRSRKNSTAPPEPPDMSNEELPMNREQLNNVFLQFASFGSSDVKYEMDSAKFAKLARDCGLLGRTLTNTDVDLIFTKTKEKGERRIPYEAFEQVALPLIAQKKFPNDEPFEGIKKVLTHLSQAAPQSSGTQADSDGTLARMTDESLYPAGARRRSSVGRRASVTRTSN